MENFKKLIYCEKEKNMVLALYRVCVRPHRHIRSHIHIYNIKNTYMRVYVFLHGISKVNTIEV